MRNKTLISTFSSANHDTVITVGQNQPTKIHSLNSQPYLITKCHLKHYYKNTLKSATWSAHVNCTFASYII